VGVLAGKKKLRNVLGFGAKKRFESGDFLTEQRGKKTASLL
jgi:hypothetical protein